VGVEGGPELANGRTILQHASAVVLHELIPSVRLRQELHDREEHSAGNKLADYSGHCAAVEQVLGQDLWQDARDHVPQMILLH
jgi:hypothetical protein